MNHTHTHAHTLAGARVLTASRHRLKTVAALSECTFAVLSYSSSSSSIATLSMLHLTDTFCLSVVR